MMSSQPTALSAVHGSYLEAQGQAAARDGGANQAAAPRAPAVARPVAITKGERLEGLDVARGLAVVGMMLRHVIGRFSPATLNADDWAGVALRPVDSFPTAIFLVLAGLGVGLLARSIERSGRSVGEVLRRRALVLFGVGLAFMFVWEHDVLRMYGLFLLCAPWLRRQRGWLLAVLGFAALLMSHALLVLIVPYDQDWSQLIPMPGGFDGLWTSFFVLGTRPVFPWIALPLVGLWLSRFDLRERAVRAGMFWAGVACVLIAQLASDDLGLRIPETNDILSAFVSTGDDPPSLFFMMNCAGVALAVIALVTTAVARWPRNAIFQALGATGRMAFTWYVGHVLILQLFSLVGTYPNPPVAAALSVMLGALIIGTSVAMDRLRKRGPLERLLRRVAS